MKVEQFFQDEKGITVEQAFRSSAKYTAIDMCKFAVKYYKERNKNKTILYWHNVKDILPTIPGNSIIGGVTVFVRTEDGEMGKMYFCEKEIEGRRVFIFAENGYETKKAVKEWAEIIS